MGTVFFGLRSSEGDRLGHLVRGVQMLRSYGDEAVVRQNSDVIASDYRADEPQALCCTLVCESNASPEELEAIQRETEWALGENPRVLTVRYARADQGEQLPAPFPDPGGNMAPGGLQGATAAGRLELGDLEASRPATGGPQIFMSAPDFSQLYDWGQVSLHEESMIGEWPSGTAGNG